MWDSRFSVYGDFAPTLHRIHQTAGTVSASVGVGGQTIAVAREDVLLQSFAANYAVVDILYHRFLARALRLDAPIPGEAPQFAFGLPQSTVYGAFLGLGVMAGAIIGHLTIIGPGGIHMAIIVFISCLIMIYFRRSDSSIFKNMLD